LVSSSFTGGFLRFPPGGMRSGKGDSSPSTDAPTGKGAAAMSGYL
jgi:hypothetical protein